MILIYAYINQLLVQFIQERFNWKVLFGVITTFIIGYTVITLNWGFTNISLYIDDFGKGLSLGFRQLSSLLESKTYFIIIFLNLLFFLNKFQKEKQTLPHISLMTLLLLTLEGLFLKSSLFMMMILLFNYQENKKLIIPTASLLAVSFIESYVLKGVTLTTTLIATFLLIISLMVNTRSFLLNKKLRLDFYFNNFFLMELLSTAWSNGFSGKLSYIILLLPMVIHFSFFRKDRNFYNITLINFVYLANSLNLIDSYSLFIVLSIATLNFIYQSSNELKLNNLNFGINLTKLKMVLVVLTLLLFLSPSANLWLLPISLGYIVLFGASLIRENELKEKMNVLDLALVCISLCGVIVKEVLKL